MRRIQLSLTAAILLVVGLVTAFDAGASDATAAPASTVTDPQTVLPDGVVRNILVDDAASRVFMTQSTVNDVLVADLSGKLTNTINGVPNATNMVLDPTGATLYVSAGDTPAPSITAINTKTLAKTSIALPKGDCAGGMTYTGGKLWFAYETCTPDKVGFGYITPSTGKATVFPDASGLLDTLTALPDRPDRVIAWIPGQSPATLQTWDMSGSAPKLIADHENDDNLESCSQIALLHGGDQLVAGCGGGPGGVAADLVFNTADLSRGPQLGEGIALDAAAVNPAGTVLAIGDRGVYAPDIYIRDISGGLPGTQTLNYDFGYARSLAPAGLAWGATGRLYAVEDPKSNTLGNILHVLVPSATTPEQVTVTMPKYSRSGTTLHISGRLSNPTGAVTTAQVIDPFGDQIGLVAISPAGTFSCSVSPLPGKETYKIEYSGDATHSAAIGSATTDVRVAPYDVNGDGVADLVVGSPGEDVGTISNAGMFHVLYSSAAGIGQGGSIGITEGTSGVPGAETTNAQFGYGQASGDFNGDGYADLAISANTATVGSHAGAGTVTIFEGSASGLRTSGVRLIDPPTATTNGHFGETMTTGDFNGDGIDDLVVSEPGANEVYDILGTKSGLSTKLTGFTQSTTGVPGTTHAGDAWGTSLSTGDINGDDRDDLAVGAPGDSDDHGYATGSATLLYGSSTGLTGTGAQRFTKDTAGVPGASTKPGTDLPDEFGWQIALADFNGDGRADLAVGAPGSPVTVAGVTEQDAGTVTVLPSAAGKIATAGAVEVSQATAGILGTPGKGDRMGYTLAAADATDDGYADLAITSFGDHNLSIVFGSPTGLDYAQSQGVTQTNIEGDNGVTDNWAGGLRFLPMFDAGTEWLAVGATGHSSARGSVNIMRGEPGGLYWGDPGSYFDQDSPGVPGTAEAGDLFGSMASW